MKVMRTEVLVHQDNIVIFMQSDKENKLIITLRKNIHVYRFDVSQYNLIEELMLNGLGAKPT